MTLALMTMPVIVISGRNAIKAGAALDPRRGAGGGGITGASGVPSRACRWRCPGMLTGTIIGMARALGENRAAAADRDACLCRHPARRLHLACNRFCRCRSSCGRTKSIAALSSAPAAAIIVLLVFLLAMNGLANLPPQQVRETLVTVIHPNMADENAKIRARDVAVFYGDKKAIDDVSIDISPDYVTAFIGPSGCGKSTFLRCFNRMNDTIAAARAHRADRT